MTAFPPQQNPQFQPKRKRRGLAYALIAILIVISIPCLGGVAYFGWRAWNNGAESSDAAISDLFQALKYDDQDRLENSLCGNERKDAGHIRNEFQDSLKSSGFELQDITWRRAAKTDDIQEIDYTLVVERDGERYKIQRNVKLATVNERGWRVCNVSGLKI